MGQAPSAAVSAGAAAGAFVTRPEAWGVAALAALVLVLAGLLFFAAYQTEVSP